MQIRRQLATLQKRGMTMIDYFNKVKSLNDGLAAASKPLEEEVIIYLLTGLNNSYHALVISVTIRTEPIVFTDLYSHMLDYEMCHKQINLIISLLVSYTVAALVPWA